MLALPFQCSSIFLVIGIESLHDIHMYIGTTAVDLDTELVKDIYVFFGNSL